MAVTALMIKISLVWGVLHTRFRSEAFGRHRRHRVRPLAFRGKLLDHLHCAQRTLLGWWGHGCCIACPRRRDWLIEQIGNAFALLVTNALKT